MVVESRSVIRNAKNARGLGRDRAAEPVRIFLTAFSGISAPDIGTGRVQGQMCLDRCLTCHR